MKRVKSILTRLVLLFIVALGIITTSNLYTNNASAGACDDQNKDRKVLGLPVWYKYLNSDPAYPYECRLIIEGPSDALPIGIAIFEGLLTLAGYVAVVMVFIGGFKYVVSQGEADRAASGRQTVINAIIGLIIVMVATRVVAFLGRSLG